MNCCRNEKRIDLYRDHTSHTLPAQITSCRSTSKSCLRSRSLPRRRSILVDSDIRASEAMIMQDRGRWICRCMDFRSSRGASQVRLYGRLGLRYFLAAGISILEWLRVGMKWKRSHRDGKIHPPRSKCGNLSWVPRTKYPTPKISLIHECKSNQL